MQVLFWCVAALGRHAVPSLVRLAQNRDLDSVRVAVCGMARIGIVDPEFIVSVVIDTFMSDDDEILRTAGISMLDQMGDAAIGAVPRLAELLDDGDEETYGGIFLVLRRMGREAGEATGALIRLFLQDNYWKNDAESLLMAIGPAAAPALQEAIAAADGAEKNRLEAMMKQIGPQASSWGKGDISFGSVDLRWLTTFATVGAFLRKNGATSMRDIVEQARQGLLGNLPKRFPLSDKGIWIHIDGLEKRLRELMGDQSLRLIDRESEGRKKGGLTLTGKKSFQRYWRI